MKLKFSTIIIVISFLFTFSNVLYACNHNPVADMVVNPTVCLIDETVQFDGSGSYDPDQGDTITEYAWSFAGENYVPGNSITTHIYTSPGTYTARLRVKDNHGLYGYDSCLVYVYQKSTTPIYVDKNATWPNPPPDIGSSWEKAYKELSAAISNASGGSLIYVAEGTYKPGSNRGDEFLIKPYMEIYGGFHTGDLFEDRKPSEHPTILSGDLNGDDPSTGDNSYRVVHGEKEIVLEGFIITGAHGQYLYGAVSYGGGMYCDDTLTVKNCIFTDNSAKFGGGVYNNGSYVTQEFINCFFVGNNSNYGGGGAYNDQDSQGVQKFTNCVFSNNNSTYDGAGVYNDTSEASFTNCTFSGNQATRNGGGIFNYEYSSPTITNCILWGNTDNGGNGTGQDAQIYVENGDAIVNYSCVKGGWSGSGAYNISEDPLFVDSVNPSGFDKIFGTYDDGLRLHNDSPCIDIGDDAVEVPYDILGYARVDVPDIGNSDYDIGAYEAPKVIYVDQDTTGMSLDGSTWSKAFQYLQDALETAQEGGEIWVAEGTYYPDEDSAHPDGTNDRNATFQLIEKVAVYGGFSGTESGREHRNCASTHTILSGDIDTMNNDDSYYVVQGDSRATIDGFTVTSGGIGIGSIASTALTIQNCKITGNGDGIVCYPSSSPIITGNSICNNTDNGIYSIMAVPTIKNNRVYNNGLGILCTASTTVSITNNTVSKNIGYGIQSNGCQTPEIKNCILWGNGTDFDGCSSTYSCFKGSDGTGNNISYFPYFVDFDSNDFHLREYSPCIDTGDPTSPYCNEPSPNGNQVDMGAYGNTAEATSKSANTDGDELPDSWEMEHFGNLSQGTAGNSDDDGLTNIEEYRQGTKPNNADTDGDGIPDGWEVDNNLNPLDASDAAEDPDGDGKNNLREFLSGGNPYIDDVITVSTTIQAAIDSSHNWDVIEIPPGTYSGIGYYDLDFGTKVITVRSQDPADPAVIDCQGTPSTPHRAFYFHNGQTSDSVVSGLIIKNGYADLADPSGGAILCEDSSPTIENCQFIGNSAHENGGAICNTGSSPTITNCVFLRNYAGTGNGGAIYNDESSNPTITNCTIASNGADDGFGGGIYNENSSSPIITNSILWDNFDSFGLIYSENFDNPAICLSFGSGCYGDWAVGGVSGSSWKVEDGILKQTNNVGEGNLSDDTFIGTYAYYKNGAGWNNYRIKMIIHSTEPDTDYESSSIAVMFRYNDQYNYYLFSWGETNGAHAAPPRGYRKLIKCDGGTRTTIAEDSIPYNLNQNYQLEILADGSNLKVFIDGQLVLSAIDNSFSEGTIAAYCWKNQTARFDDIVVCDSERTQRDEFAQIYGSTPNVKHSCIQDEDPLDTSIPFNGIWEGNIDDAPDFHRWVSDLGLVAYWQFNEVSGPEVKDSTGTYTGTVYGGATWVPTGGKIDGGLSFDGSDDYVDLPDGFSNFTEGFTVSVWAKPTSVKNWARFIDFGQGSSNDNIILTRNGTSNDLTFQVYNGGTAGGAVTASNAIVLDQWQHFVVTLECSGTTGNVVLYMNGHQIKSGTTAVPDNVLRTYNYIGKSNWGGDAFYNGILDEIMIFDRALSASEVEKLYRFGCNNLECDLRPTVDSSCVDSGHNGAMGENFVKDISGFDRIIDGDNDSIAVVDMGAYEFDYDTWWSFGKVSQWSFDEGIGAYANDLISNNNGIIYGPAWTTGKTGSALSFDGSNDYVDVGQATSLSNIIHNFTVVFWAWPLSERYGENESSSGAAGSNQRYVIGPAQGDSTWGVGHAGFGVSVGTNGISVYEHANSYLPPILVWNGSVEGMIHIAVVYLNDQPRLYVNGKLKRTGLQSSKIVHPWPKDIGRGYTFSSYNGYYDGTIDELTIYNRALSAREIEMLAGNRPPVLAPIGDKTVVEGDTITFNLYASDPDGDEIGYSAFISPPNPSLLLHFDGSNGATVTTDSSIHPHNVSLLEGAQLDTSTKKFGTASCFFDGSNDYGLVAGLVGSDNWEICADNTDDWTVDFWIKQNAEGGLYGYVEETADSYNYWSLFSWGDDLMFQALSDGSQIIFMSGSSDKIGNENWHHVVLIKKGSEYAIYLDGQQIAYVYDSDTMTLNAPLHFGVGHFSGTSYQFMGNMDELRITHTNIFGANPNAGLTDVIRVPTAAAEGLSAFEMPVEENSFTWKPLHGQLGPHQVMFKASDGLYEDSEIVTIDVVQDKLAGYWSFDETIGDVAHSGNYVIISGATWTPGKYGNALNFAGTDYLDCGNSEALNFGTSKGFTIAAWIKTGGASDNQVIFNRRGSAAGPGYYLSMGSGSISGKIKAAMMDGTNEAYVISSNTVNDNRWHHVAAVYKSDAIEVYIDGDSMGSTDYSSIGNIDTATNAFIGKRAYDYAEFFIGKIDELVVYNRALYSTDIEDLYQNGPAGVSGYRPIDYWKFDEGAGEKAYDSAAYKNQSGTVIGIQRGVGRIGHGLNLDGSNDYVELPSGFSDFSNGFSVALWAYPTNTGSGARFIDFGNGAPNNNIVFARNGTSSNLKFQVYPGNTVTTTSNPIELNKWQFFVATVNSSGNVTIYKNDSSVPITGTTSAPANVLRTMNYIGKSNWDTDALYQGRLDEVMIFNRVLSQGEVQEIYTKGLDGITGGNPVSYWGFEESSGNIVEDLFGDDGYQNGTIKPISRPLGKVDNALNFDGSGYVSIPSLDSAFDSYDNFTVTAWFKVNPSSVKRPIIGHWHSLAGRSTSRYGWELLIDDDGVLKAFLANQSLYSLSGGNINDGNWHFVALVYQTQSNQAKLYLDGGSTPWTGTYDIGYHASKKFRIGAFDEIHGSMVYLNGVVDETMVFDRALNSTDIGQLYENGSSEGGFGDLIGDPPIAYWTFNETCGPTVKDSQGNHNGTYNGILPEAGWIDGEVGSALNLSGQSDYVVLQNMNGAYYSVGFWAKFSPLGVSDERIIDLGGTNSVIISRYGTSSQLNYVNGSCSVTSDTGFIINSEWHYYTVVHVVEGASKEVLFYRDGVQYGVAATTNYSPTASERTACYIGSNSSASGNYFTGLLDELRIYERSLSDTEVEALAINRHPPVLTTIGDKDVETSNLLTFSVSASDDDDEIVTFNVDTLPPGALFNGRTFSWIPAASQVGSYTLTFTASDGVFTDNEVITITVAESTGSPQGATKTVSGALGNDLALQVDPFTGSASYNIPIALPPARQGTEPSVSLNYSGGGNGLCGFGWSLSGGGAIQRDTRHGVPIINDGTDYYDDAEGFVVSFSSVNSRLVLVNAGTNEYRAETDQAFLKYIFDKSNNQWIVTDKSGNKFYFGEMTGEDTETVGALMTHPLFSHSGYKYKDTFMWALAKILDINKNTTYFDYVFDGGQMYLYKVRYNGNLGGSGYAPIAATHTVEFVLEDRADTSISYGAGYRVETNKRLREIVVKISDQLVRRYKLGYEISPSSRRSLLHSVNVFGTDNVSSLPPVVFEYQKCPFEFGPVQDWGPVDNQGYIGTNTIDKNWNSPSATGYKDTYIELLDINGDGLPDRVMRKKDSPYDIFKVQVNTGEGFERDADGQCITSDWGPVLCQGQESSSDWGNIQGIDDGDDGVVMLFDIDGDGLPDRVMRNKISTPYPNPNILKVQFNNGFGFDVTATDWTNIDSQGYTSDNGWNGALGASGTGGVNTQVMISDIDGDGLPDRVMRNGTSVTGPFEVQLNNGNGGFENSIDWGPKDAQGDTGEKWNSPNARSDAGNYVFVSLLDLNGDGLPDRVMSKKDLPYTVFKVQFNTGYGFEKDDTGNAVVYDWGPLFTQGHDNDSMWGSLQSVDGDGDAFVMLFDISADGLPDRVMRNDVTDFSSPKNVFKVQLNTGNGFEQVARLWRNIDNQGQNSDKSWNSPYGVEGDGVVAMLFDINGDGLPDRVMRNNSSTGYRPSNNVFKVQLNKGPVPDLLKKVYGRLGGDVEVTYTPSTRYDNTDNNGRNLLPFPVQTVSSVTTRDGLGTESTVTYDYARGYFDTDRREFKGFGKVEVTDPYGAKTVTYFHQGGGYDDTENGEFEDEGKIAKKGIPYRVETYGSDGKFYSLTINEVEQTQVASGKDWYFAYIVNSITMDYEGLDTYLAKAKESVYNTSNGNIIEVIDYGAVEDVDIANHSFTEVAEYPTGHPNYILHTHTDYKTFTNNPDILSKVEKVWTGLDDTYGNRLTETKYTYDDCGRLTMEQIWFKDEPKYITAGVYAYDQYGNRRASEDTAEVITATEYDATQTFPVRKVTGKSVTGNLFNWFTFEFENEGDKFITTSLTDARSGLIEESVDVMGIKTQNHYDVFFRLTDIEVGIEPGEDPSLWITNVEYNLGGIENGQVSRNFIRQRYNGYEAFIYNDGLGRVVQTRLKAESGADGEYRAVDVLYDKRGNVSFTTNTFFSNGSDFTLWDNSRPGVITEFDPLGRVCQIMPSHDDGDDSPAGPVMTEYKDGTNPWARIAVDPEGKITKTHFDARGNVVQLIEVIGAPGDNDDITTTHYYDQLGRLWKTVDKYSHEITAVYDSLGRKTQTYDPDMGIWYYDYDDVGRLIEQRDSRDNKIELIYTPDQLGRLMQKKIYAKVGENYQHVTTVNYYYDNYEGKTGYDSDYRGFKGLLYKVEKIDVATSNVVSWRKFRYDSQGRNDKTGQYIKEKREQPYITLTEYDDAGRVHYITYPYDTVVIHYDYGSAGELTKVESTSGTGDNEIFYTSQGYDEDGKAIGVEYGNGTRTDYGYYEYSKRLKRIHTLNGSVDLQDLAYTFDKASNIKSITDAVYTGSASAGIRNILYDDLHRLISYYSVGQNRTVNFTYNDMGNIIMNGDFSDAVYSYGSKPHAVTSVLVTGNTKNYQYDAVGNMTSRDVPDGTQTLTYDEENQLVHVTKGTSPNYTLDVKYGYEYDGTRLWKKDVLHGNRLQIWIGSLYEEKYDLISGQIRKLCHVYAGGELVATFEPYGSWSSFIRNTPVLAQINNFGRSVCAGLFGDGRTPLSMMSFAVLSGLCFGLYYTKRRMRIVYGLEDGGWFSKVFYTRDPWRQVIIMMMIAAFVLCSFPQKIYAGTPSSRPVFYYYHSDHLGSSSIITDRDGAVVQHYEYTAFGKDHYQHNTQAFSVTNRYTGQSIDEDTGLYYYSSRYYDPQLARFIQADTIVPSSTTSQALNRYTYVNNNPLKFTDPTGHGWFSDLWDDVKEWIGTIINVGLTLMGVPVPISAIIGSAVSTAVNGGTFANFACGMGIGIAGGYISNALGVSVFGKAGWESFIKDPIGMFAAGALQGSIMGAISSAVYGQNLWKGMCEGALGGIIGVGVALGTEATLTDVEFGGSVIKDMASFVLGKAIEEIHFVIQKIVTITQFVARTAIDIAQSAVNTLEFVMDDIASHFRVSCWVKGQGGIVLPVKVFESRRAGNGLLRLFGLSGVAMNAGGEIHIGPDMYMKLLASEAMRWVNGVNLTNNPIKWGTGTYTDQVMAHELGHQVDVVKFGVLYAPLGFVMTNWKNSVFELNAWKRGEYYGIVPPPK